MPKIFFLLIILVSFFTMTSVTFAQQTIRSIDISPRPIERNSPTAAPESNRPSSPSQPNTPRPTTPQDTNFCGSFIAGFVRVVGLVGGRAGSQLTDGRSDENIQSLPSHLYSAIFPRAEVIYAQKELVLQTLKQDPKYSSLSQSNMKQALAKIISEAKIVEDSYTRPPNGTQANLDLLRSVINKLENLQNQSSIDIIDFYAVVLELINTETVTKNNLLRFLSLTTETITNNNLPNIPFMVFPSNIREVGEFANSYPKAPNIETAMELLGCSGIQPSRVGSLSPLIHIYSPANINITLPQSVTFTNYPNYSLLNGASVATNLPLYYEVNKPTINKSLHQVLTYKKSVVIEGVQLEKYLKDYLLPQLQLNQSELNNFLTLDINPQLRHLVTNQNYELFVLQNREVDYLIPLSFTPHPQSTTRNLIVVQPTDQPAVINPTLNVQPVVRQGISIIENGFISLN